MTQRLTKQLQKLPSTPGVYQFLNAQKEIIYVGKAAVLKDRVRSYFRNSADLSPAKRQMVAEVVAINIVETESEIEALLLEANLIKKIQPYYNVTLRDDKSYIYVKVSTEEEWPRVFATRKIDKAGTYFGPFTSAHALKETLRVLRKFLPYRCNQKPMGTRACFWFHIGRCPGTCVGAITQKEYRTTIRRILLFFEGRMEELKRAVKKELGPERVAFMENVLAHTRIVALAEKYASDVRELARVLRLATPLKRIEGYDISNIMGREAVGSMVVFQNGEPVKGEYKKFKIKTVQGANDVAMVEEILTRRLKHTDWPSPDLMIIDGGKAQLNTALRVLRAMSTPGGTTSVCTIPVIAIAKGGHGGVLRQKEEMYLPGEKTPLKLSKNSPALHLVLRVRDEAHRFAIGYHTTLRQRRFLDIPRAK